MTRSETIEPKEEVNVLMRLDYVRVVLYQSVARVIPSLLLQDVGLRADKDGDSSPNYTFAMAIYLPGQPPITKKLVALVYEDGVLTWVANELAEYAIEAYRRQKIGRDEGQDGSGNVRS